MPLLNILQFPDLRLKNIAAPVEHFDQALVTLVKDMLETMYEAQGVGLAAIQVNVKKRLLVMDISSTADQPMHLVNPTIVATRDTVTFEEGCLSFPGVWSKVKRAKEIDVTFYDQYGKFHELSATGLLCQAIQHEIDHLNGITFYDRLSPLKQQLLRKKLDKIKKRML
jgi:peptide deformylase